jgi:S-adenosylmethionine:tRNA ribosyltransferase-isomerase
LRSGDVLVVGSTRVFHARLYGRRAGAVTAVSPQNPAARNFLHGQVGSLTRQVSADPNENEWECLVRPGRKIGIGEHIFFSDPVELEAVVSERGSFGERRISLLDADFFQHQRLGRVPLPPYIDREDRATGVIAIRPSTLRRGS